MGKRLLAVLATILSIILVSTDGIDSISKPVSGTPLNPTNSYYTGLILYVPMYSGVTPKNLVNDENLTMVGTVPSGSDVDGGYYYNFSQTNYFTYANTSYRWQPTTGSLLSDTDTDGGGPDIGLGQGRLVHGTWVFRIMPESTWDGLNENDYNRQGGGATVFSDGGFNANTGWAFQIPGGNLQIETANGSTSGTEPSDGAPDDMTSWDMNQWLNVTTGGPFWTTTNGATEVLRTVGFSTNNGVPIWSLDGATRAWGQSPPEGSTCTSSCIPLQMWRYATQPLWIGVQNGGGSYTAPGVFNWSFKGKIAFLGIWSISMTQSELNTLTDDDTVYDLMSPLELGSPHKGLTTTGAGH